MNGVDVSNFDTFRTTVRDLPGKTVPLEIERSGEPLELQVTLADRNPGTGERGIGFLGVSPAVDVTYVKRNVPEAVQRSFTEFGTPGRRHRRRHRPHLQPRRASTSCGRR